MLAAIFLPVQERNTCYITRPGPPQSKLIQNLVTIFFECCVSERGAQFVVCPKLTGEVTMSHSDDDKVKARRAALVKVGLVVGALYAAPAMVGLATAQADGRSRPSYSRQSRWSRPSRPDRYYSKYGRGNRYSRPSRPSRYGRYSRYSRVSRPWITIRF